MDISERIHYLTQLIAQEECFCHRDPGSVKLLAVSKGHSSSEIEHAFEAGLSDFGESYLQEALIKINTLSELPLCWHFIGPIQSNKTDAIAHHFSWVHSVSRSKIAQRLNDARSASMQKLNICLQINMDKEDTKSGIPPEEAETLARYVLQLPQLDLRGLMMIPKPQPNDQEQYESFLRLAHLLHSLNQSLNISMDTLSMGMSHDFKSAIRAGSTMVRIGTAIFGDRMPKETS